MFLLHPGNYSAIPLTYFQSSKILTRNSSAPIVLTVPTVHSAVIAPIVTNAATVRT
jgi:hypothetical protein